MRARVCVCVCCVCVVCVCVCMCVCVHVHVCACACVCIRVHTYSRATHDELLATSLPVESRHALNASAETTADEERTGQVRYLSLVSLCVRVRMYVHAACVCVCVCVCVKKMKDKDSLARKNATSISCVVDTRLKLVAVNSSALQAVEWCNPSTSCYV